MWNIHSSAYYIHKTRPTFSPAVSEMLFVSWEERTWHLKQRKVKKREKREDSQVQRLKEALSLNPIQVYALELHYFVPALT